MPLIFENMNKEIKEIADKIVKTRKVVTIHASRVDELCKYLNLRYSKWNCKFMQFGETVHIMRKIKFIPNESTKTKS